MEKALNTFNYSIYLILKKFDYLFNKVNPVLLLYKIPFIKKYHEKNGWNPYRERAKIWNDKKNGFNIWIAEGILMGVIFGILIGTFMVINNLLNFYEYVPKFYYIVFAGLSLYTCYLFVFKKDKYLGYFKQYERWTKNQKRKYVLISFLAIIATIAYFFMGLMCC